MDEKELNKYDVIIIDEDIILSSVATDQCTISMSTLREMLRIAHREQAASPTYKALAMKIKSVFKNIRENNMFKLDAFEWDIGLDDFPPDLLEYRERRDDEPSTNSYDEKNEEIEGISALTDIPSFCLAEYFVYREASKEIGLEEDCITFLRPFKFKDIKCIMVPDIIQPYPEIYGIVYAVVASLNDVATMLSEGFSAC